jgi:hypothetical protein
MNAAVWVCLPKLVNSDGYWLVVFNTHDSSPTRFATSSQAVKYSLLNWSFACAMWRQRKQGKSSFDRSKISQWQTEFLSL